MDYFHYTYKHNHIDFSSHIYKVSTYHYNWHGETEILILLKGRIEMSCNSEVFTMEPLDSIIISPQVGHATLALEADTTALVIHVGKDFFSSSLIQILECINLWCVQISRIGIIRFLPLYDIMQR